jgi:hypothetical protein
MRNDLIILGIAAVAAFFILKSVPAAAGVRRVGKLEIPDIFTSGGGWLPSGAYDPNLLDRQYAEGWGYGD